MYLSKELKVEGVNGSLVSRSDEQNTQFKQNDFNVSATFHCWSSDSATQFLLTKSMQ